MECKVKSEPVTLCGNVFDTAAEIPFDTELPLPDYCQDIGKILRCRAVPELNVRELRGETVRLEGIIRLSCMYSGGRDKSLRCCEHELPFAADVPAARLADAQDAAIYARVSAAYVNCRALSQRKLDIHGALNANVRAEACRTVELMTSAEGAGVRTHSDSITISRFVTRKSMEFTVSETLELGQGKPPVLSIIRSGAGVVMTECKPIANKLIVKGELPLEIVYSASDGNGAESMGYSLPFSQFIDMTGVGDGCDIDIGMEVTRLELAPRTDADGEYRIIAADIHVLVEAAAYEETDMSVLTDAYSVECELTLDRKKLTMEHLAARADGRCGAVCRLETSREIEKVLDCWCEINNVSAECKGSASVVKGTAAGCAIVRLADGELEYLESPLSFESETELPGECRRGRCAARAAVRGCVCNISAANRLELRADIDTTATLREDVQVNTVCSITPDENRIKRKDDLPAAVMYFGEAGEELWSIARENNSSAEDIAADNGIDGQRLEQDKLLLIVVNSVSQ